VPSQKRQRQRENSQARAAAAAAARRRRDLRTRGIAGAIVLAIIVALVALLASNNSGKSKKVSTTATTLAAAAAPVCPKVDGSSPKTQKFSAAPGNCLDAGKSYVANMVTDVGTITIALDQTKAPLTVNNFVFLARYHYFDGTVFHRVIPDFVDQGGDPTGTGTGDPGYKFKDELPQPGDYKAGSLAMANSGPDTNGSQFFIVVSANGAKTLTQAVGGKASYTLFGQITAGMDIALKINADGSQAGTPTVQHHIQTVTITET